MSKIFDPIRKKSLVSKPEERIRQKLVQRLINELHYPKGFVAIELLIDSLDHVKGSNTNRRADIICFAKIHPIYPLYPLLVIECKAVKITEQVIRQVEGYNAIIQAYYFAVANEDEVYTCWLDRKSKKRKKVNYLPTYQTLLEAING